MTPQEEKSLVEKLKAWRTESYEATKKYREEAKGHKRYFAGEQLPADVMSVLENREQPVEWENTYKKLVNKVMGLKILQMQEVQATGRQVEDKNGAVLITNILKSSQDSTDHASEKMQADLELFLTGISFMETVVEYNGEMDELGKKEKEIRHYQIPLEQAYFDPYYRNADGSDMRYFTKSAYYDKEYLKGFFDEKKVDKLSQHNSLMIDQKLLYEPQLLRNSYTNLVLVNYTWHISRNQKTKAKEVYYTVWADDTMLEHAILPFLMKKIPISVRRYYPIDKSNSSEFYSPMRDIKPIQDRINFTHLRIANMLGSIKLLIEDNAVDDVEIFSEEYLQDEAIVTVNNGALQGGKIKEIKYTNDIAQLQQIIIDKRRTAEEIIGLNAELLGTSVQRLSGYAIENRQNTGLVGLQLFLDASLRQDMDNANMAIKLIQQYINAEQVYKIVDKWEADEYFVVNQIARDANGAVVYEDGEPKRTNKLNFGRYDIVLRPIPASRGSIAERQRNWGEVMKLYAGDKAKLDALLPRMLRDVESPVATEVLHILEDLKKEAGQNNQAEQLQMQQMQLQMQQMQAKIQEIMSKAMLNQAQAEAVSGGGATETPLAQNMLQ